ncbi:MAG: hypothetical protein V2I43_02385 [Parvularcula sp.]|jgi:hypothetical protein|nr:hypothetical protein [Parvularcula sp.]
MARDCDGVNIHSFSRAQPFSSGSALETKRLAWHPLAMSEGTDRGGKDEAMRTPHTPRDETREERLARALRENLRRRKAKKD